MAKAVKKTVDTDATQLTPGGCLATIKSASGDLFLGGEDVTPETGMPYGASDGPMVFALEYQEGLYAIAESGSETIHVLETW